MNLLSDKMFLAFLVGCLFSIVFLVPFILKFVLEYSMEHIYKVFDEVYGIEDIECDDAT